MVVTWSYDFPPNSCISESTKGGHVHGRYLLPPSTAQTNLQGAVSPSAPKPWTLKSKHVAKSCKHVAETLLRLGIRLDYILAPQIGSGGDADVTSQTGIAGTASMPTWVPSRLYELWKPPRR